MNDRHDLTVSPAWVVMCSPREVPMPVRVERCDHVPTTIHSRADVRNAVNS